MLKAHASALILAGSLLFAATAVQADPAAPAPQPAQAAPAATDPQPFAAGALLETSQLETLRGGQDLTVAVNSKQVLSATSTGNQVTADTVGSGAITLDRNALSNFSGIGNFVMNTGHNNNLQGSLSINVISIPASAP